VTPKTLQKDPSLLIGFLLCLLLQEVSMRGVTRLVTLPKKNPKKNGGDQKLAGRAYIPQRKLQYIDQIKFTVLHFHTHS
jgi:hypothetical protein